MRKGLFITFLILSLGLFLGGCDFFSGSKKNPDESRPAPNSGEGGLEPVSPQPDNDDGISDDPDDPDEPGVDDSPSQTIGGLSYHQLGQELFRLEGVASRSGRAPHHFKAHFTLLSGEEVRFIFFSSRFLDNGLSMTFSRRENEIWVTLEMNRNTHSFQSSRLSELISQGDTLDLEFDIHNDHSDLHTLIWEANGPRGDRDNCSIDSDFFDPSVLPCLYNSEDFALDYWLGVGQAPGIFWGVQGRAERFHFLRGYMRALSDA